MKKLILLFLCLSPSLVCAQKVLWSLNVAPGISYRIGQTQNISEYAESAQIGEEPMYVFDFGIDLRTKINDRLSLGTGIYYSQKGFSNTHVAAVYDDPLLSRRYLLDFVQDYLDIPFYLSYTLIKNEKIEFYPLLGVNNSLLLSEKNSVTASSGEISEESMHTLSQPYLKSTQLHNLGMISGIGVLGIVDAKTAIGLEAINKVMFSPLADTFTDSRRYLYSFNLNFKFVRKIR